VILNRMSRIEKSWRSTALARRLCVFRSSREGSMAVEFALVLPPLLFILTGIIQIMLVFIANQHLENATADLGRLVRTGQAQGQKFDQAKFKDSFCNQMGGFIKCESGNVLIDVQALPNFGPVSMDWPVDDDGNFEGSGTYSPGGGGDIVLVRVFYQYPVWLPMIGQILANLPNGKRMLTSSAAFRNEPF
jgi:Flp pilus assembly protein TadG